MRASAGWAHAAVFGALWGALELSVGTALQLSRLPLRGTLMAALGLVCLVTLRRVRGGPGSCLLAGAVAIVLKVVTLGGLFPGPLIGIGLQAVLVEASFAIGGRRPLSAAAAGAAVLASHPIQMILMTTVIAGPQTVLAAAEGVARALSWLGVAPPGPWTLAWALVVTWSALGALIGLWAWRVASRVARRLEVS